MNNFICLLSLMNRSDLIGRFFGASDSFYIAAMLSSQMLWAFLRIILATVFVALLAYFATKMIALTRARAGGGRSGAGFGYVKNLRVVESIAVGGGVMIQLIKAGEKYLVVGVTRERVNLLSELTKEQIEEFESSPAAVPFSKIFSRFLPQAKDGQREEDSE